MSSCKEELFAKVWVRTATLENASARLDEDFASKCAAGDTNKKGWDWALARLYSGGIEHRKTADNDNDAAVGSGATVVKIEDDSSLYDGQTIVIPSDLLFSSPSDLEKGGMKKSLNRSAVRKFGASLTSSSAKTSLAKPKMNKDATIPNILMANPSDSNHYNDGKFSPKVPHDLQSLNHLHEPSVVHTLKRRYDEDMIYTSTGPQILVALNPFKATNLYEESTLNKYAELGEWEQSFGPLQETNSNGIDSDGITGSLTHPVPLPPHVFRIADTSFRSMMKALQEDGLDNAGIGVHDPVHGETTSSVRKTKRNKGDPNSKSSVIVNQSLLVSGESGSGKTVTTKHCLRYLASLSQRRGKSNSSMTKPLSRTATNAPSLRNIVKAPSHRKLISGIPPLARGLSRRPSVSRGSGFSSMGSMSRMSIDSGRPSMDRQPSWILGAEIEVKILEANPILESFGNARTVRNDNSSRFGKYIELFFSQKGSLIGATIETYLLEKVRLIHSEKGERNYHIFYEIMDGASEEELKEYLLEGYEKEDFKIINQSGTMDRRDGVDDQEEFDSLIESMALLQFEPHQIRDIMRISVACMHALNLTFTAPSSDESDLDDSNPHLQKFLTLTGLKRDDLRDTICFYEILIGGREKQRRNQSKESAAHGMEGFIKSIYSAMFNYLVDEINQRISLRSSKSPKQAASIGILDIFGFESFQTNSLEQLMINYCNEALQQLFNRIVFKSMKEEYDSEGIDSSFITFPDNKDALDAIDSKGSSVLSTLDDMSFAPGTNDEKFASNLYQRMDPKSTRFVANSLHKGKRKFVIVHYAGHVEYSTEKWIEKNKDEVPRAMIKLLESSSNEFVNELALSLSLRNEQNGAVNGSLTSSVSRKRNQKTVGKQFSAQLKTLRTKIDQTTPYFVRCIKPNQELTPDNFSHGVVLDQLKSLGVLEAVRVSRSGFSKSYTHEEFIRRYRALLPKSGISAAACDESPSSRCNLIIDESLPLVGDEVSKEEGKRGIQLGRAKVFLRQNLSDSLDSLRSKKMRDSAITIQTGVRVWLARNELFKRRIEFYSTKIQTQARRMLASRRVKTILLQMCSATLIQSRQRGVAQRKEFNRMLEEKKQAEKEKEEEERRKVAEQEAAAKQKADQVAAAKLEERRKAGEQEAEAKVKANQEAAEENRKAEEKAAAASSSSSSVAAATITQRAIVTENAQDGEADVQCDNKEAHTKDEVTPNKRLTEKEEAEKQRRREEEAIAKRKLKEQLSAMNGYESFNSEATESADAVQLKIAFAEVYGGDIRHSVAKSVVRATRSDTVQRPGHNEGLLRQQDSIGNDSCTRLSGDSSRSSNSRRSSGFRLSKLFGQASTHFLRTKKESNVDTRSWVEAEPVCVKPHGMYSAKLPVTEHGLLINITSFHGGAAFASYRKKPDGKPGPAEINRLIKSRGDRIISVNGEDCQGKPFAEVIGMMVMASKTSKNGFCDLVMQDWKSIHYQL